MKLSIRTRHLSLSPEALAGLEQRVHLAFARISAWIRAVDITVTDINGPKGGADKQCRVRVRGRSIPSIVVEHVGFDTLATVGLAAERAEQVLVRRMARRRGFTPLLAL